MNQTNVRLWSSLPVSAPPRSSLRRFISTRDHQFSQCESERLCAHPAFLPLDYSIVPIRTSVASPILFFFRTKELPSGNWSRTSTALFTHRSICREYRLIGQNKYVYEVSNEQLRPLADRWTVPLAPKHLIRAEHPHNR
jgi:hypothetical protein